MLSGVGLEIRLLQDVNLASKEVEAAAEISNVTTIVLLSAPRPGWSPNVVPAVSMGKAYTRQPVNGSGFALADTAINTGCGLHPEFGTSVIVTQRCPVSVS